MTRHHHASGFLIRFSVALLVVAAFGEFSFAQQAGQGAETSSDSAPTTNTGAESPKPTEQASAKSESGDTKASESKSEEPPPIKIPPPPPQTGPKIPFELQRYEVELPIVFEPSAKLGPAVRESVIAELRGLIDRSVGPMWNLKIEEPRWITPQNRTGLERLTSEVLKQRSVELRFARVVREQLSEYTEGKFPVESETQSDEMLAEIRHLLTITDNEVLEPTIAEYVTSVAGEAVDAEKVATVSEVVYLYLTPPPIIVDKIFPVSVEVEGGSYIISAREWDRESELLTTVRTRTTVDRRTIAAQILRLLGEVFRPTVLIDEATPQTARIKYKAGEFPPGDPAFAVAKKDAMFIPFFRYLDRNKVMQKLQFLPWSYITATSIERIRADCELATGVKTPLGSFKRRRMELRALALKPYTDQTTLTLVPKRNRTRPLVGYLVAVYDEIPPPPPELKPGEEPSEDLPEREKPDVYRSDRFGNVTIPVDPNKPLQWIFIRSGSALLAKFPLVAGAEQQMTVECPDDTIRLDVEGQIVLLQSRLVDTIAKQAMVKAMITNRVKAGEWKKVDESLKELDELPTIESFETLVSEIQYPALKKAEERGERSLKGRISKLGDAVLKVARIHLDQQKIDEFREDIVQQRQIDDPDAPRGKRAAPGRN
ncbi:MAG: hypothetical protein O2983_05645 [Planctomycetota bacterium]|nr:hypothetical protein [Planctomycetota bacterium]MDA0918937.1 hypothetical protein [Planctomycetota bacterium]MDA1159077.1 hypothetical protein [Planctomycetota bacterium]